MNFPEMDNDFKNRVKLKFLEHFTEAEMKEMLWGIQAREHSSLSLFTWTLLMIKSIIDNPGNPPFLLGNTLDIINYNKPYKNVVLEKILPILAWALDDICPQYGSQSSTGHSQIAVRLTSRDPVRVWVAVGPFRGTLQVIEFYSYDQLRLLDFRWQRSRENEIGSDLGLALSSLRLRLDCLESALTTVNNKNCTGVDK